MPYIGVKKLIIEYVGFYDPKLFDRAQNIVQQFQLESVVRLATNEQITISDDEQEDGFVITIKFTEHDTTHP